MNLSDQQEKQFVWALDRAGLTQHEIAEHPFISVSQATVSRWLNDYDPVEDGFDASIPASPKSEEAVFTENQREAYRKAVFEILKTRSVGAPAIKMAENNPEQSKEVFSTEE